MVTKTKEATVAYHEAGHAVAAWRLRIPLHRTGVTIVPDGEAAGTTSHHKVVGREIEWDVSDRTVLKAERFAQVCLAGGIAQRHYCPQSVRRYHTDSDHHNAIGVLINLAAGRELEAWLKLLYIRTENMLANQDVWRAVQRLAEALVQRKTIRGKEATEIIRAGFEERLHLTLGGRFGKTEERLSP
jgi:hypothetical protein